MNMQEIREIAKTIGVKSSRVKKVELIHRIQLKEGNFDCFATATSGECDQLKCSWREDCFASAQKPHN